MHDDSRIFSGAMWDLRTLLGANLTDDLVIMTMKTQPKSFSDFLNGLLVIDDDDGNLGDGTPHINQICDAFHGNHGIYSDYCSALHLTVISPQNTTYASSLVWANVTLSRAGTWCGRSLDGAANVTMNGTTAFKHDPMAQLTEGSHDVAIYCNDAAGYANSTRVTFAVDTIPPALTLQSPLNQTRPTAQIWFNLTANEPASTAGYSLDGAPNVTLANSSGNWNQFNSSIPDGIHTAVFFANDTAGNSNSTSVTFVIDTLTPHISFAAGTEANNSFRSRNWILLNVSITRDWNLANLTFYLHNSTAPVNATTFTDATTTRSILFSNLAEGTYRFNVTAYDSSGNANSTETREQTLDATPPAVTFRDPTPTDDAVSPAYAYINVTSSETLSTALLEWNGTSNDTMSGLATDWYLNKTDVQAGNYTFRVYGNDTAGNWNSTRLRRLYINRTTTTTTTPAIYAYNFTLKSASVGRAIQNATLRIYNVTAEALPTSTFDSSAPSQLMMLNLPAGGTYDVEYALPAGQVLAVKNLLIDANALMEPQFVAPSDYLGALPSSTTARSHIIALNDSTLSYERAELTLPITGTVNRILHCTSWSFSSATCLGWESNALSSYNYTINSTHLTFAFTHFDAYAAGYYEPPSPAPTSIPAPGRSGGGGGGGGGGGSGGPTSITRDDAAGCASEWSCGNWSSSCLGGTQTRTCTDANNCTYHPATTEPALVQRCAISPKVEEPTTKTKEGEEEEQTTDDWEPANDKTSLPCAAEPTESRKGRPEEEKGAPTGFFTLVAPNAASAVAKGAVATLAIMAVALVASVRRRLRNKKRR